MECLKAVIDLSRVRYTIQIVGILLLLWIRSKGVSTQLFFAVASILFLCIALYSLDDAHDHVSDFVVHSDRPIPRGILTPNQVYLIGTFSFCLGFFFATGLLLYQLVLFVLLAILGLSLIFIKLSSLLRAILISLMIFILLPFSTSMNLKNVFFGLIVAIPHFSGSIAKDFIHSRGDERIGLQPPFEWERYLSSVMFFANDVIILLPIIMDLVTWLYVPSILPIFLICMILAIKILNRQYRKVYAYGRVAMLSALIVFAVNV